MSLDDAPAAAKVTADVLSASILVGTLVQILPAIAALVTILYSCIRIYETATVQRLLGRAAPLKERDHGE